MEEGDNLTRVFEICPNSLDVPLNAGSGSGLLVWYEVLEVFWVVRVLGDLFCSDAITSLWKSLFASARIQWVLLQDVGMLE